MRTRYENGGWEDARKHVSRGRYMAAVCYTCYRPPRTGYVRQSIALILVPPPPLLPLSPRHSNVRHYTLQCYIAFVFMYRDCVLLVYAIAVQSSTSPSDYLHLVSFTRASSTLPACYSHSSIHSQSTCVLFT